MGAPIVAVIEGRVAARCGPWRKPASSSATVRVAIYGDCTAELLGGTTPARVPGPTGSAE
jgi:hypothetical protein